jgi:signal transduction histidine kinase
VVGSLRSLRFQLPALFVVAVVLFGLVAAAIAFQLLQSYTLNRARTEVRREARALTQLYIAVATGASDPAPREQLEAATGDRIYYVPRVPGFELFQAPRNATKTERRQFNAALPRQLGPGAIDLKRVERGERVQFEFSPPESDATFLAVASPLNIRDTFWGALVVAKQKDKLSTRVVPLLGRLGIALLGGLIVAAGLAVYLSRRLTRPLVELSGVADEIALGHYDVAVPPVPGGTEVAHLADRFNEMARRLSEAEQRERNFLMSVSHELRTPLTAIRGHVAALSEGLVEDPDARAQSLEVVSEETERLARLVGDVLDLAKLDAHRFTLLEEEVDMEKVVARAYSTFNEEARRRGIEYRSDVHEAPTIVTDGDRVLQIITNLLSNAFRWTPDGGEIELELGTENGTVSVSVSDTGPGISDDNRERIFRPFWSDDAGGGTGLGLAIANELAQALGGHIALETALGRGSRFELVLPAERYA